LPPRAAVGGTLFGLLGLLLVGYLAYIGADADEPPSVNEVVAIALFTSIAQVLASFMWSRVGRAHPSHARSAVIRLWRSHIRAAALSLLAQKAYEEGTDDERRLQLGIITATLDAVAEDIGDSLDDWATLHPSVVDEIKNGDKADD